jgi:acyl phosphate:glycerol-3-phosphate acyltransferase
MIMALLFALAYFAGSVNFSILLFRILGKDDPRYYFSGNAGVTNVYRQAGIFWAGAVLILDVGRALAIGAAALYLLDKQLVPWVGLALVVGNSYPCFHGFQGGKGVASYIGFTAVLSPVSSILSCIIWVIVFRICRIPFMASFFTIIAITTGIIYTYSHEVIAVSGVLATALLIFYNHKRNIISMIEKRKKEN